MERRRIQEDNSNHLSIIADTLKERIIGQDHAIDGIMGAFDKARLRDERRPVASLMFLGTTGVGKTETAETLADLLAVDKLHPAFTRIDCAQYAQGHEVANLVGAPPGYVGREQKPVFDKDIIEMPGSVVLFDEIEKGHPKLWNYLLQIMEGGQVKLMGTGETVNFNNSVVIMTSNVGAREMQEIKTAKRIGFTQDEEVKPERLEAAARDALKRQFSPEFINRLDAAVMFNSLDDDMLKEVLGAHVERSNHRYRRMGNFALRVSDELKSHLVVTAEERTEYGARPVLRNYEREVETRLSRMVAKNAIGGTFIYADHENDDVTFYEEEPLEETAIMLAIEAAFEEDEPECETDEKAPVNIKKYAKRKK